MANMTFKASLLPNTDLGYSLGSDDKRWKINDLTGNPIEYIVGTQTAATGSWTGVTNDNELVTGKMIAYKLPFAGSGNASLTLTLADGTDTDAIPVYAGNTRLTTHYPANSVMIMIYDGANWRTNPYYNTNTNTLLRTYSSATDINVPLIASSSANSVTATWTSYTGTYKDWYGAIPNNDSLRAKINLSTGHITAPGGITADLTGNASTATKLATARTLKIGTTGKTFDGSANVTWTHEEIGATVSNTITAGTASATPKISTTVNGVAGTAVAITTATTGIYGCTKLTSSYTSTDSSLAATGASIAAAIGGLDVAAVGGGTGEYISEISQTNGEISATKATTTVSNAWTDGTTAGPTLSTTVNGITGTAVAIPTATVSASGAVTTGDQTWAGVKHHQDGVTVGARTAWNKGAAGVAILKEGEIHIGHATHGGHFGFHFASSSTTTAYISERISGTVTISSRLAVNSQTHWQTLGGATTTTAFDFAVLGNGFIRNTIYTNAGFQIRKVLTSTTAWDSTFIIYNNGIEYGNMQIYNGTTSTEGYCRLNVGNNRASTTANNATGLVRCFNKAGGNAQMFSIRGALGGTTRDYMNFGYVKGTQIWGAVWNDYAEFRETHDVIESGRCVIETGNGDLVLSTERLQNGAEIISDTYGFAIGQNEHNKTPIAVSGRVLAYLYEDKDYAKQFIGYPVCSGPEGTVSIMTEQEASKYPWKIIGTISEIPNYDKWQIGEKEDNTFIDVNGRVWIRI